MRELVETPEDIPDYLQMPLDQFLDSVASGEPAPGGGSMAAVVVALAAGLSAMVARFSCEEDPNANRLAERAENLRRKVGPLARADAEAYGRVLSAYRLPREQEDRKERVQTALSKAADVPLSIAEVGAGVAELATHLLEKGNPNLKGDAVTAILLAEAGVCAAVRLVRINTPDEDDRLRRAKKLASTAADLRAKA